MNQDYIIVDTAQAFDYAGGGAQLKALQAAVNAKIAEGYIPLGGVTVRVGSSRGAYFLQAMVRRAAP